MFFVVYRKKSKNLFTMIINVEGGFPIKRFVLGDGVLPNVSDLLNTPCSTHEFDFLDIRVE